MPTSGFVAGYWAMDGEIALHAFQLGLPATVSYCLPVLGSAQAMCFAPWKPGDALASNRFGIPEPDVDPSMLLAPADLALVVMPLVAFDDQGHRLGMGGGHYDRSFAFRNEQAAPPWLVGAAFCEQRLDAIPPQPWDIPMDAVCTERATTFPNPRLHGANA